MKPPAKPAMRRVKSAPKTAKGETLPEQMGSPAPRLPHEIDESAHSQSSPPRNSIQQAFEDVERGLVDAGSQPVMDDLYRREFKEQPDTASRVGRARKRRP